MLGPSFGPEANDHAPLLAQPAMHDYNHPRAMPPPRSDQRQASASARPATLAYADHAAEVGGAEISLRLLIRHLDRQAFRPMILHAPGAAWLDDTLCTGDTLLHEVFRDSRLLAPRRDDIRPSLLGNFGKVALAARPVLEIRRLLRRHAAALVHTNTLKCHLLAGAAGRLAGVPVVWHLRDIVDEEGSRQMLRRAAAWVRPTVIAISQAVAQQVAGLVDQVHVIHNGVPLDDFQPGPPSDELRRELGLGPDDRVLMIVARLTPWKGHRQLLQALPLVAHRFDGVRFVVVGDTNFWEEEYLQELKDLAQAVGVAERVVWTGHREDIPELLKLAEVFVLPSRDEPFGRAIVEAMAMGKPVVAGRGGAAPEVCPDGLTGHLVDADDPRDLAEAVISLLADPARAAEMGQAGRERALSLFDAKTTARRVQDVYRELLK
ncbi:MAG: glycosyltransferase family 4 protein [Armatimonadetes bacterium]|nr:glycosyltransferase family 4 protein [Armatimonadota bacterium]